MNLTPREIVQELDKFIVGQMPAKRAVAVALRNRLRRARLSSEMQAEVTPKNILMIGPTGVGKTEIARRLAKLVGAPFVKVEATKFTEVGYVGRDVDSMVRDLVETAVRIVKSERIEAVKDKAQAAVVERLVDALVPRPGRETRVKNPLEAIFGMAGREPPPPEPAPTEDLNARRAEVRRQLEAGELEHDLIEVELEEQSSPPVGLFAGPGMEEIGQNFSEMLGGLLPKQRRRRRLSVAEARRHLLNEEATRLIDMDQVTAEAVSRAENSGIIFLDEIDKIAGKDRGGGPDVSREGVQRDILPIVEGSTVVTKYGPVQTQHVLFVAAGAFHTAKPSDLIPELQGRFPIRVELTPLTEADFMRILTEPENALTKQYAALLQADGVAVDFRPDGVGEIARVAAHINAETEDIGARRLHTIMEKVLEDLSYAAPDQAPAAVTIDQNYVSDKLSGILKQRDLSRFIL